MTDKRAENRRQAPLLAEVFDQLRISFPEMRMVYGLEIGPEGLWEHGIVPNDARACLIPKK